jgi:hypothetical protein
MKPTHAAIAAFALQLFANAQADSAAPAYEADGRMRLPAGYREWVFLSSGFDMSYRAGQAGMHMFDNVFVNPEAYRAFLATGTWPDKTMLVSEQRGAGSKGSINKAGQFQTGELMGVEVHVKDSSRFGGQWAFFGFDGAGPAAQIPAEAACYSCHREHAAVDTTFVQFYPTLLDIARTKGTLSAAYMKETAVKP